MIYEQVTNPIAIPGNVIQLSEMRIAQINQWHPCYIYNCVTPILQQQFHASDNLASPGKLFLNSSAIQSSIHRHICCREGSVIIVCDKYHKFLSFLPRIHARHSVSRENFEVLVTRVFAFSVADSLWCRRGRVLFSLESNRLVINQNAFYNDFRHSRLKYHHQKTISFDILIFSSKHFTIQYLF